MGKSKAKSRKQADKWYYLAKEQGYRSRSSFKLIQLNKKYHFLEKTKVLIDLCAAPGGWLQVASKYCMSNSLICGVDLVPIKPIPNVITFTEDITSDKCREKLRHYLKTWKADTILHDGSPNLGTAWIYDAYSQAELVLMSLKIVTEFLIFNGTFITKVFRSKDYNNLLWVLNQLFGKVEATKPLASRDVSSEIFVVCREYKAPDKIDPKFLDPKFVYEDLPDPNINHKSKIFNPSKKKRHREGYEDGNYTQHKTITAEEFLKSNNPIEILSIANTISLDDRNMSDFKEIKNLDITTEEIIECCKDLRVLGKKDFRGLLKWRTLAREKLGLDQKKETNLFDKVEINPLNNDKTEQLSEDEIENEINRLNNKEIMRKKREKRRMLELKRKSIQRMQLGMIEPMDIGLEQSETIGSESVFTLSSIKKLDKLEIENENENEKMDLTPEDDIDTTEPEMTEFENSENEIEELEKELDQRYEYYLSKKEKKHTKSKINSNFDSDGLNNKEIYDELQEESSFSYSDKNELSSEDDDTDDDADDVLESSEFIDSEKEKKLSRKTRLFFDRDVFKIYNNNDFEDSDNINIKNNSLRNTENYLESSPKVYKNGILDNNIKPLLETTVKNDQDVSLQNKNNNKSEMDILTADAMALAQKLASSKKSKRDIIDDAYNKWSFQDNDNLPEWFLDDERKYNKRNIPISKEAVMAIREKLKAINARPIKKVLEAKARKKSKVLKRLKRMQAKTDSIIQTNDMSERRKAENIEKLLNKALKSKNRERVKIVVAKGVNKGIKGRPKGVKGRYKLVDPRMKKELRAVKRRLKKRK